MFKTIKAWGRAVLLCSLMVLVSGAMLLAGENISFHGYGELHYNNTNKSGSTNAMDFHRMVLGWSYGFNDNLSLEVEVDFEHSATEMELEFAYIDYRITDAFNLRAGSMLMPVGYLNEFHEPPLFYSVERPYVQKYVIPTTWAEGGVGIYGYPVEGLNYRVYLVGGLDASGFEAGDGIRDGRSKVAEAPSDDLAIVGRIEYDGLSGINIGSSIYTGNAAQGDTTLDNANVNLIELDLRYKIESLEVTGLYSLINVGDTEKIFASTGEVIGNKILGWYAEAAYHFGPLFNNKDKDLVVFLGKEKINTHYNVVGGLTADPANDKDLITVGIAYYPDERVAFKADLENWTNGSGTTWRQFNLGVGYMF